MTEKNPPLYLQTGSHPAEDDRLGISSSFRNRSGIVSPGDLLVAANGTPNMTVNVAAGRAIAVGSEATLQGAYHVVNDASKSLTISAANATNPRRDLIVAKVQDSFYSGATNAWSLAVITGTAAASPVDPAIPANSFTLARISVGAAVTTITSGNITDLRPRAASLGGIEVASSSLQPSSPTEGHFIWETDTDSLKGYTTATTGWRAPWNLPWGIVASTALGAGSQTGITTTATDVNIGSVAMALSYASVLSTRKYRVGARLSEVSCNAAATIELRLLGGLTTATTQYQRALLSQAIVGDAGTMTLEAIVSGLTSGTWAWKVQAIRATGSGTVTVGNALLQSSAYIYLEDVGPASAPA